MKKFALVIKARSKEDAKKAARRHGIILDIVDKHPHQNEVIATAGVRVTVLQDWYNEARRLSAPFPIGTLLHFTEVQKTGRRKVSERAEA